MAYEVSYGPKVDVGSIPGLSVAVRQTYGGQPKKPVMWRGMVTFFWQGQEMMDVECTLLESKQGGDPFPAWPQRQYEDNSGNTKYKSLLWMHSKGMNAATGEAIRMELGDSSLEDDDVPI